MIKLKQYNVEYLKGVIMQYIPNDRFKAIKVKDCASLMGVNPRIVRHLIQELRGDGYPICSTPYDGYWVARSEDDVNLTIKFLDTQKQTLEDTIKALEETKKNIGGNNGDTELLV